MPAVRARHQFGNPPFFFAFDANLRSLCSGRSGTARNFNLFVTVRAGHERSRAACLNGERLITAREVEVDVHSKGDGGIDALAGSGQRCGRTFRLRFTVFVIQKVSPDNAAVTKLIENPTPIPWSFVGIVQGERCFVFERIRLEFVRDFAKRILDESFLQSRLFALRP